MTISWLEAAKLTVPILSAILLVWIKTWIESHLAKTTKQNALARLLRTEIECTPQAIEELGLIGAASTKGNDRIVSFSTPSLVGQYCLELATLDGKRAFLYADTASSIELVDKGLDRLSELQLARLKLSPDANADLLVRAINGQARSAAIDYIGFAKAGLKIIGKLPTHRRNADDQLLATLDGQLQEAEKKFAMAWPPPTATKIEPSKNKDAIRPDRQRN